MLSSATEGKMIVKPICKMCGSGKILAAPARRCKQCKTWEAAISDVPDCMHCGSEYEEANLSGITTMFPHMKRLFDKECAAMQKGMQELYLQRRTEEYRSFVPNADGSFAAPDNHFADRARQRQRRLRNEKKTELQNPNSLDAVNRSMQLRKRLAAHSRGPAY